ncbi:TPA: hypothetical protein ACF5NP_000783 [Enterococcus faecium]|uniref:hypothetical protein n=1 Tax=Enterococcus TaxID=1350 RepID=UPI000DEBFA62|nr:MULTISPECIES: hypothetical protein [Enterococcus]EGP5171809.1 hypothetical protein [Enterococcus faecium]MEB4597872.1 hypothetical protein [Enterococcus sp. E4-85]RBS57511.1 hypothetical protein EB35_00945 [Enterococcus faecium]
MSKLLITSFKVQSYYDTFKELKEKKVHKMNEQANAQLIGLAANVAEIAIRNTASTISDKIRATREKKDDKATIAQLEEIINDLITDKNQLLRAIKIYEDEFVAQKLTTDDISYITNNIIPAFKDFASELSGEESTKLLESLNPLEKIVTIETLNVLQLIGFNFKRGLGQPLTEKLKKTIEGNQDQIELSKLATKRDLEYFKIIQDPEAYQRFLIEKNG